MTEIKWIKLTTTMFEDEKIDFIESLPDADAILIIWIKLLTLAGKCNSNGYIFLTENIPYDEQMLAHKFKRPLNTVKLAIETFERLHMLQRTEQGICIINWEKHQNILGMERIKIQNRLRQQKFREEQKLLSNSNVTVTLPSQSNNAIDIDIDIDKDINIYSPVIEYLNSKCNTSYRASSRKTKDLIKARVNDGFVLEDFKKVIDIKSKEWINTDMAKYLRPETLFGTKFESYLNQKEGKTQQSNSKTNKFHNFIQSDDEMNLDELADKKWEKLISKYQEKKGD